MAELVDAEKPWGMVEVRSVSKGLGRTWKLNNIHKVFVQANLLKLTFTGSSPVLSTN